MKDPLSRVLLEWGDTAWYWMPFKNLRPVRDQRLGVGLVLLHTFAGALWPGLLFATIGWLVWPRRWSLELFLLPAAVGAIASFCWAFMLRLAWNRRAAEIARRTAAGEPPLATTPLNLFESWLVQPAALLAVLALALALVAQCENIRGNRAWQQLQAELRAAGAPVDIADVIPPPIPEERNLAFSPLFRPGLDYERPSPFANGTNSSLRWRDTNGLNRLQRTLASEDPAQSFTGFVSRKENRKEARDHRKGWSDGVAVNLKDWRDYYATLTNWPKPAAPGTPAADVLVALGRYDADLKELRAAAAERPDCRFPLRYDEGPGMLLPTLAPLKRIALFLRLRSCALLAENRSDEALQDIQLATRLGDAVADEPILISFLVRLAVDQIALQPVWEGCRDHRWSDAQLAALQTLFGRRDYLADTRRAIEGERVLSGITYDMLARRDQRILDYWDPEMWGSGPLGVILNSIPRGWIRQSQVAHNRYLRALVTDLAAAHSHQDLENGTASRRLDQFIKRNSLFTLIASMLAPSVDRVGTKAYETETWRRLALVGLALERHRLAAGRYPATLAELAPKFLAVVPDDPMVARPFHYTVQPDGDFRLYSVGRDYEDNAGKRSEKRATSSEDRRAASDMVWR